MKFKYGTKTKHPLYWRWRNMLLRCASNHPAHVKKYRARGIKVCASWQVFENFIFDMGPLPSKSHSLDRVDNNGNYEPSNCRWATKRTQSRNRRYIRPITFGGRTQLLTDWATEIGVNASTLSMRMDVYGWSIKETLSKGNTNAL